MALKRPEEKHWNWKTPKEPFPQTPGANGCFCAPSGQGKTTTLIAMLLGPYAKIFDELHIFSPVWRLTLPGTLLENLPRD